MRASVSEATRPDLEAPARGAVACTWYLHGTLPRHAITALTATALLGAAIEPACSPRTPNRAPAARASRTPPEPPSPPAPDLEAPSPDDEVDTASSPHSDSTPPGPLGDLPTPDVERIEARLRAGRGLTADCGMSITETCRFHLYLAHWGKLEPSERCLAWREAARQRPDAPAARMTTVRAHLPPGADESAFHSALELMSSSIVQCYEEGLAGGPPFEARIAVRLTVDARGCITRAVDVGSSFPTSRMRRCTINLFLAKALPAPTAAPATVKLNLALSPDPSRTQTPP